MLTKRKLFSFATLMLVSFATTLSALSDSQLHDVLSQLDAAAENRDLSTIASYLSDRARIQVDVPTPEGLTQVALNKEQYLASLAQAWSAVGSSYRFFRESTEIASDGSFSQVVSVIREEFEAGGQTISSKTLEITDFAMENGKIVIVKVVGRIYFDGEPKPKPSI